MKEFYPIFVALAFNGLDLATGLISALKQHDIQSSRLRDGLFKKAGFLICYFLGWLVDTQGYHIGFEFGVPILGAVILYVVTTEIVSILENVCKINPDILPDKLMAMFHVNEGN